MGTNLSRLITQNNERVSVQESTEQSIEPVEIEFPSIQVRFIDDGIPSNAPTFSESIPLLFEPNL